MKEPAWALRQVFQGPCTLGWCYQQFCHLVRFFCHLISFGPHKYGSWPGSRRASCFRFRLRKNEKAVGVTQKFGVLSWTMSDQVTPSVIESEIFVCFVFRLRNVIKVCEYMVMSETGLRQWLCQFAFVIVHELKPCPAWGKNAPFELKTRLQ